MLHTKLVNSLLVRTLRYAPFGVSLPDEDTEVKASTPVTSSGYYVLLIETPTSYEQGLLTAGGR